MALWLIRPLRFLAKAFSDANSPKQLAWGFALGMMIGLVPKGNLIGIVLLFALFGSRVNLASGLAAAFLFSWIGPLLDPLSHVIGLTLLTAGWLRPLWEFLYSIPLMPWSGFNNTVVMGSLLLGGGLFYPAYRLSHPLFERWKPLAVDWLRKRQIARLLLGANLATSWRI